MTETVVIANLRARPGRGEDLLALFGELVPLVLSTEPDTLRYAVHAEPGSDPLRVTVIEKYVSPEAFDAHHHGAALVRFGPRIRELVDGDIETTVLTAVDLGADALADERARF